PRRRRHATLREPVERPLRGPAQRALGSAREHREGRQGLGTVSIGERAERVVQGALGQAAEVLEVEGRSGHPKLHPKNGCCGWSRSEEHTSELQSLRHLVCRLLLEKKKTQ